MKKHEPKNQFNVSFPIGAKLVFIITLMLFVSLGMIILIVSLFVSRDVERTAWDNSVDINSMSSMAADIEINSLRSKVSVLLNDVSVLGDNIDESCEFFFEQNPKIAAVFLSTNKGNDFLNDSTAFKSSNDGIILQNQEFISSNNLKINMFDAFLSVYKEILNRGSFILNAAPALNKVPILALLYDEGAVVIFFSSEKITESFGTGAFSSLLINERGDVLVSVDQALIGEGANLSNIEFIRKVLDSDSPVIKERFKDSSGREFFGVSNRISNSLSITSIPTDVVYEGIRATTRRNIFISFGVWFLALMYLWFFSKTISNPLASLNKAVQEIEMGNYKIDLKSKWHDETGLLTSSLLSMSHVLENFEMFTNKEIARLAQEGKLAIGGSKRMATIFFSDIRSFTAISEKLSPYEVVSFLNDYMDRMVACVLITGGTIDKFIGDAVMAHWGAVGASDPTKDALSGVSASLMMRASLMSFNKGRGDSDKNPIIRIGAGLNSGSVVAGQIGSKERVVFTVIGDAVSMADRTETFNKSFGTDILITENTYKLVGEYLITEEMAEVKIRGGKTSKIYSVINTCNADMAENLIANLDKLQNTDRDITRRCIGVNGPKSLSELRKLIGISAPNLTNFNLEEAEKKYTVSTNSGDKSSDKGSV